MKIVFDSTVLVRNFHLQGPNFRLFEWYLNNEKAGLVVPQIVIEEVKNKYREITNSKFESTSQGATKLGRHIDQEISLSISSSDLENIFTHYDQELDDKLASIKTEIPTHSDIPHQVIVERDLARKAPFRKVGKNQDSTGYRDALIWEVILQKIAPKSKQVIFITNNETDFWGKNSTELHGDLQRDLTAKGMPYDRVIVCKDIECFNDKYIKPKIPPVEEAKILLEQGNYHDFSIIKWFDENLTDIMKELEEDFEFPMPLIDFDIASTTISWIDDPSNLSVEEIFELDEKRVFINAYLEGFFSLSIDVYGYGLMDYFEDIPLDISIDAYDKNCATISAYLKLPIELTLIFNIEDEEVEDFGAKFLDIYGWCRFCGEPFLSDAAETCSKCGK